MDAKKLKNIVNFDTLFQKVASFVINRHIIEQRFEENEDKMLQGYLLLLRSLMIIKPELKVLNKI